MVLLERIAHTRREKELTSTIRPPQSRHRHPTDSTWRNTVVTKPLANLSPGLDDPRRGLRLWLPDQMVEGFQVLPLHGYRTE